MERRHRLSSAALVRRGAWLTRGSLVFVAFHALLWGWVGAAWSQTSARSGMEIFPTAHRQLEQLLTRARDAIKRGEFEASLDILGPILAEDAERLARQGVDLESSELEGDALLAPSAGDPERKSFKLVAAQLLSVIPAKDRKFYELEYGARAEALLNASLTQGTLEPLREGARKYYFTRAGLRCATVLAMHRLQQGEPRAGVRILQPAAATPQMLEVVEPETLVVLAGAFLHAGDEDQAFATIKQLRQHPATQSPTPNSRWAPPNDDRATALAWLRELFGAPASIPLWQTTQWWQFRGNDQRNAAAVFAEPLAMPRWRVPLLNHAEHERTVAQQARLFQQQEVPCLPALHPLVVGELVLFRDAERLVAVDLATGKRAWEYHWLVPRNQSPLAAQENLSENELRERMWLHAPYGQLTSDGEQVYLVEAASSIAPLRSTNDRVPIVANRLVCLNLKRQGKMVWSVGGPGEGLPRETSLTSALRGTFFLGPPLVVEGQLHFLGEQRSALFLFVIDRSTGKLLWKQQLLASEAWQAFAPGRRHLFGAVPSYADGMLVCPTGAGAVMGIDLIARSLRWTAPYPSQEPVPGFHFQRRQSSFAYADGWMDHSATLAEGKILLTPFDAPDLFCFDLFTGKRLWTVPREDAHYVGAVRNGIALLVCSKRVRSCRLENGEPAWPDVPVGLASGRGIATRTHYFLPLLERRLVGIGIATGERDHNLTTPHLLGNLAPSRDSIISLSHEQVAAYFRVEALSERVAARLATAPQDPWAVARQAELFLHRRDPQAAWDLLEQARQSPQHDAAVPTLLATAGLALLEQDFAKHEHLIPIVQAALPHTRLEQDFYRVVARGREQQGALAAAFSLLLKMEQFDPLADTDALPTTRAFLDLGGTHRLRVDRWIDSTAARLWQQANGTQREEIDALILQELKRVHADSIASQRRFVERFGFHAASDEVRLQLARQLLTLRQTLEAELLLAPLLDASRPSVLAAAQLLQLEILAAAQRWPEAAAWSARYFPQGTPQAPSVMAQLEKQAVFAQERALHGLILPTGKVHVAEQRHEVENRLESLQTDLYRCRVLQADPHQEPRAMVLFNSGRSSVVVRDVLGRELQTITLRRERAASLNNMLNVRFLGHLMLVSTGNEVVAMNTLQFEHDADQSILWRMQTHALADDHGESFRIGIRATAMQNAVGLSRFALRDVRGRLLGSTSPLAPNGVCFLSHGQLQCVSPLTGEVLWQRSDIPGSVELTSDEEFLYVLPTEGSEAIVLRRDDGQSVKLVPVPPYQQRLALAHGHVLMEEQSGQTPGTQLVTLKLQRLSDGAVLWQEQLAAGTQSCFVEDDEIVMLQPSGRCVIRSLHDSAVSLDVTLEREPTLEQLHVLRSREQYLIFAGVRVVERLASWRMSTAPRATSEERESYPYAVPFTGKIYAFHRATGAAQWSAPAAISEMGLPLDQPLEQPVLVLHRNLESRSGRDGTESAASLLCLDKRTGELLYFADEIPGTIFEYDVEVAADRESVKVLIPQRTVTLKFTSDPSPPTPPVQFDQAFNVRKGITGGLKRALFPLFAP